MQNRILRGLLIDDEQVVLSSYQKALRDYSIDLCTFDKPIEALRYLNENLKSAEQIIEKVDFLFCDFSMPDMNGIELFNSLPDFYKENVPCVLHSGSLPINEIPSGVEYFHYLEKPILMEELVKYIRAQVQKHHDEIIVPKKEPLLVFKKSSENDKKNPV